MVRKAAITLAVAFSAVLAAAATVNRRILIGEEAKEGEFPFIVRLHYEDPTTLCGGSLLDSTTVITAAHCVGPRLKLLSVRAGSLNKDSGGVVAEVESILKNPEYKNFRDVKNDIAILKLSTPIEESETISYVKLPASGSSPVIGSIAVAAGWGITGSYYEGEESDKLLKVAIPINGPADCTIPDISKKEMEGIVCTGFVLGKGDSGGPLIDQETGQLIGISSTTVDPLALFVKVSGWLPFIHGIDPRSVTG